MKKLLSHAALGWLGALLLDPQLRRRRRNVTRDRTFGTGRGPPLRTQMHQ